MQREEILRVLYNRLGDGIWFLVVLNKNDRKPLSKEKLKAAVNELYKEKKETTDDLINSRHALDIFTARLEGAGLVDIHEVGRARLFQLSHLGEEFLQYIKDNKL